MVPLQPLLQLQSLAAVLPAGLLLLAGQEPGQEVCVFVLPLYFPASQFTQEVLLLFFPGPQSLITQVPPAGPLQPALQVHLLAAVLPAGLLLFGGHDTHSEN